VSNYRPTTVAVHVLRTTLACESSDVRSFHQSSFTLSDLLRRVITETSSVSLHLMFNTLDDHRNCASTAHTLVHEKVVSSLG